MTPRVFEIKRETEILAYGIVFSSGKCIMEWTGDNNLVMIWQSYEEMKVVADIMKATITFY
jgi:hypothetical protein